ncbi:hypothetical protein C5614_12295 [Massilia phosphatilytica]|nr:hypothetical protein C5614_12295 [Massilia phosphatilytica]
MFHRTFASMNTRLSMVLPSTAGQAGERLADEVQALLREQESIMSRFVADGDLAVLNRSAGRGAVPVSDVLWTVLDACMQHHRLTGGAFDIAQGAGRPGHGMHQLNLDPRAHTVRFTEPGLQLDLGGIGKGIALDLIRQLLVDRQIEQAFLSFGESSVAVIGSHPTGGCWAVGVEHMFEPGTSLHRFDLHDGAMSTSGNRPGETHIIDPATGQAVSGCRTVSVACPGAADAEALSTALFVLPAARRAEVLRRYPGAQAAAFDYGLEDGAWRVEKEWRYEQ